MSQAGHRDAVVESGVVGSFRTWIWNEYASRVNIDLFAGKVTTGVPWVWVRP